MPNELKPILCAKCNDHIEVGEQCAICEVCASTQESAITELQGDIDELRKTAIEWHKYPEEKPPTDKQTYLVTYKGSDGKIHVCESWLYGKFEVEEYETIPTHWAYLPAPPKEEE